MIFYGRNVTLEALKSSIYPVNRLMLQENINKDSKIQRILELAQKNSAQISYIDRKELGKISKSDQHQGVIVDVNFQTPSLSINQEENSAYVYISEATFEHNIGAIIRSCEVAGLKGVILPKKAEITPTVARTSAGAIFHIPIFQESIFNAIKKFQNDSFFIFGIERDGKKYFDVDKTGNILFIIGGEDKSLSDAIRKKCDEVLEIPQAGKVNSLNMSVATSIVIFDRIRQLHT